jgi:hypothetical protein
MADPLAAFRKHAAHTVDTPAPDMEPGGADYVAFHAVDREPRSLSIIAAEGMWVHASYAYS